MQRLNTNAKTLLIVHNLFILCTALASTFVNVFIWKLTQSAHVIGIYTILQYSMTLLFFVASGYISRKKGIQSTLLMGILLHILFYVSILTLRSHSADFIYPLGALLGAGLGFYWFSANSLIYYYTDATNRGFYLGLSASLAATMATIAPLISGYIIVQFPDFSGYYFIFGISFIIFAIAMTLSLTLDRVRIAGAFNLPKVLGGSKAWNHIMAGMYFIGLREGTLLFLTNIILYKIVTNELGIGQFTTFTTSVGILSSFIVGKVLLKRNRKQFLLIGTLGVFFSSVILVSTMSFVGLVINGVLLSIFSNMWSIPHGVVTYETAGHLAAADNNMTDYVVAREIPLNLGRITGILIYLLVSRLAPGDMTVRLMIPMLSAMLIINYLFVSRSMQSGHQEALEKETRPVKSRRTAPVAKTGI